MPILFLSFIAGVLTVLAPCVFPLLPVIIGGSSGGKKILRPFLVTLGLILSIIIFTVLIRLLLPPSIERILFNSDIFGLNIKITSLTIISGGLLILIGLVTAFPVIWDKLSLALKLSQKSDQLLEKAERKETWYGPILVGAALGPVFTSCSPTFGALVAIVLPSNFLFGLLNIIIYSLGLGLMMLAIGLIGQELVKKLRWLADPRGVFKKILGVIFIIVGIFVFTSLDKQVETIFLESGYLDNLIEFEQSNLQDLEI
jgi:cytochrome c-type biogenesis protein